MKVDHRSYRRNFCSCEKTTDEFGQFSLANPQSLWRVVFQHWREKQKVHFLKHSNDANLRRMRSCTHFSLTLETNCCWKTRSCFLVEWMKCLRTVC